VVVCGRVCPSDPLFISQEEEDKEGLCETAEGNNNASRIILWEQCVHVWVIETDYMHGNEISQAVSLLHKEIRITLVPHLSQYNGR